MDSNRFYTKEEFTTMTKSALSSEKGYETRFEEPRRAVYWLNQQRKR